MTDGETVLFRPDQSQDVEAAGHVAQAPLGEESLGDSADLILLGGRHGLFGPSEILGASRLDLDEDERLSVGGDDVDLSPEKPESAGDDGIFLFAEIVDGGLLAQEAEAAGPYFFIRFHRAPSLVSSSEMPLSRSF